MKNVIKRVSIFLVLCLGLVSRAEACAVCFTGEGARWSFTITTILLTVLPLLLIGGFAYWLKRRYRRLAENTPG